MLSSGKKSGDQTPPLITLRALILGILTIIGVLYYLIHEVGHGSGSGSYVRSQFPMVAFMPFVLWIFINTALKRVWPRLALRRGELLTIFSMLWVVGALPQWGWSDYWIAITAAPIYLATPENQWSDLLFPFLPWDALPNTSARVVDTFWLGLPEGASVPWDGWYKAILQWLGASLGMVVFGFCLVVLFQRQWAGAEKLTFPLAQMPMDLTQGLDGPRGVPDLFRSGLFWIGFALVFLPLLYNIAPYFTPGDEELREAIGQADVEVDLPDLVDAWGQPIIYLRRQRPTGELVSTNIPQFGQFASTTLGAYTAASTLGELGRSQVENTILPNGSADPTRDANLARVLGHPSLANQSRGGFMVLSAGTDGIYLSRTDGPGTEDAPVDDLTPPGTPYPSTIFDEYDDLLTFGGT